MPQHGSATYVAGHLSCLSDHVDMGEDARPLNVSSAPIRFPRITTSFRIRVVDGILNRKREMKNDPKILERCGDCRCRIDDHK